jgi:CRISPR-associated protein Csd2
LHRLFGAFLGQIEHPTQRVRQAMLGCAPAQRMLDFSQPGREQANAIIEIGHQPGLQGSPRTFADYVVTPNPERLPAGVKLLIDGKPAG